MSEKPSDNQIDALWQQVRALNSQAEEHPLETRIKYEQLLKEVRRCNDRRLLAETLHLLGKATYFSKDYEATLRYNSEALDIALLDEHLEAAFWYQNALGITRLSQGLFVEALDELIAASRLAKQANEVKSYVLVLSNIALCQIQLGEIEKAYRSQKEALEISKKLDIHKTLCFGQVQMMEIQNARMRSQEVIDLAPSTLQMIDEYKNLALEISACCHYSFALRQENRPEEALNVLNNVRDYKDEIRENELSISLKIEMACTMKDLGYLEKMHQYLEDALYKSREMGRLDIESQVQGVYAQYFEEQGNYKLALKHSRLQNKLENHLAKNIFNAHARSLVNYAYLRAIQRKLEMERRQNHRLKEQNFTLLQKQKKFTFTADTKTLTGLMNYEQLTQNIQDSLSALESHERAAFLLVEIDRPSIVSELQSYELGDQLIREVADRLAEFTKAPNIIGCVGSNEFGMLLQRVESRASAEAIAHELLERLEEPYLLEDRQISICISVGCAIAPEDGDQIELLEAHADMVALQIRQQKAQVSTGYPSIIKAVHAHRLLIEEQLPGALQRGEFELYYQGRFDSKQLQLVGFEALLRWQNPQLGQILPSTFLPLAEQNGLIEPIGLWIIQEAAQQAKYWQLAAKNLKMAINFSDVQLQPKIIKKLHHILRQIPVHASSLIIELNDPLANRDLNQEDIITNLNALHKLGYQILLDNFGNRHGHLMDLYKLPIDQISLDKSFIQDVWPRYTQASTELLRGLIDMAHRLDIKVLAEGVEQKEQLKYLQDLGVDLFQGFHFHKPENHKKAALLLE